MFYTNVVKLTCKYVFSEKCTKHIVACLAKRKLNQKKSVIFLVFFRIFHTIIILSRLSALKTNQWHRPQPRKVNFRTKILFHRTKVLLHRVYCSKPRTKNHNINNRYQFTNGKAKAQSHRTNQNLNHRSKVATSGWKSTSQTFCPKQFHRSRILDRRYKSKEQNQGQCQRNKTKANDRCSESKSRNFVNSTEKHSRFYSAGSYPFHKLQIANPKFTPQHQ